MKSIFLIALLLPMLIFGQTQPITLSVTANDPEGGPLTYLWSQTSGPGSTVFDNATVTTPTVRPVGLWKNGTYVFQCVVKDNQNATVTVTQRAIITVDQAPVVGAGVDQIGQLPLAKITLTGTITDAEGIGTVNSINWSMISGPNTPTIVTPSGSLTTDVTGLVVGLYKFRFRAGDAGGASAADTMNVTIGPANMPPTANAGSDQVITLPSNSVTIGKLDPPGLLIQWVKMSGPSGSVISQPTSSITQVTNLKRGTYVFRKIARNAAGVATSDDVTVIVKKNVGFVSGSET